MSELNGLIQSIFQLFGLTGIPTTAGEFLFCSLVVVVGLFVVKYCMLFVLEIMKEMVRIR